jgi:hypothetical protein
MINNSSMNNDSRLIFEAYLNKKQMLNEAPPAYAMGDLDIPETKLKSAPGGGYGLKKAAAKAGKSIKEVSDELVKKIQTQLFKPEPHTVDGIEYNLFYPGNEMKLRNDLQNLVQNELGLGKTEAGYTARIVRNMLNIIVKDEATGGVAVKPAAVQAAVATAVAKPVKTETVYEIDKSVNIADKPLKTLLYALPDEDVHEKEILSTIKDAIREYNDTPGLSKEKVLKIKPMEAFDKLSEAGALKTKQKEVETKEGEGSGEVETIEDYPESDEPTSVAKELGYVGRGRGLDPGSFSYQD